MVANETSEACAESRLLVVKDELIYARSKSVRVTAGGLMVGLKANIDVLYNSFSITLLCAFGRIFVL